MDHQKQTGECTSGQLQKISIILTLLSLDFKNSILYGRAVIFVYSYKQTYKRQFCKQRRIISSWMK